MRQIHPMTKLIELATSRRSVLKGLGASGAALALAKVGTPSSGHAQEPGVLRVGLSGRDMGTLHPAVATGGQDTAAQVTTSPVTCMVTRPNPSRSARNWPWARLPGP
jgi:hypothetical protein